MSEQSNWNVFRYGEYHKEHGRHEQIRVATNITKTEAEKLLDESNEPMTAYLQGGNTSACGFINNSKAVDCLKVEHKVKIK